MYGDRFVLDTGQRRGGRRRCLGTSLSPTRWTFIAKQHYKRSTSTLRLLASLMLIAVVIFVVVVVVMKFRDDKHKVQRVYDATAPAETEFNTPRRLFSRWLSGQRQLCGGGMTVYGREFARLRGSVVVDRRRASANRRGGEPLNVVLSQPESYELYQFSPGFFQLSNCDTDATPQPAAFNRGSYLNDWMAATRLESGTTKTSALDRHKTVEQFTVALTRSEYANLYHTMSDWYNVFLLTQFFNVTDPAHVHVLLVDAHPAGPLDNAWNVLFKGGASQLSDYEEAVVLFSDVVWSIPGHRGPLEHHYSSRLPLVDQFRRFVLSSFDVDSSEHRLDCSSIVLLLISRRDYVTHVRNPAAIVRRKIANEQELEAELRTRNPHFRIKSVQLERLSVQQQLRLVASSDVVVAMHGAGLTHAIFLPDRSGLVEIVTGRLGAGNRQFQAIARWRRIEYERWTSQRPDDDSPETNYTTYVPPEIIDSLVKRVTSRLCPQPQARL